MSIACMGCSTQSPTATLDASRQCTAEPVASDQRLSLAVDGRIRTFLAHIPPSYDATRPPPLILVLHASGEDGCLPLRHNGWQQASDDQGFIVTTPDALPLQPDLPADVVINPRIWASGEPIWGVARQDIDDVRFIDALVDDISSRWNVERIFVAGHSGGGSMAFRLAVERPGKFAAIATVSGLPWLDDPVPTLNVPTIFILGTADPLVPLAGGREDILWIQRTTPPVAQVIQGWAATLRCPAEPVSISDDAGLLIQQYNICGSDAVFQTVFVAGQGHGWPGGEPYWPQWIVGPSAGTFNATQAIVRFFKTGGN